MKYPPSKCRDYDRPNANLTNDTKTGISAYIRLSGKLAVLFQTTRKMVTLHLQYWENLINDHSIKTPITDTCNIRVSENTYNVNLESLKGGKHLRYSEYTIYTDSSKKVKGIVGGFVVYLSLIHI